MRKQPTTTTPTIEQYMTASPHTIGRDQPLTVAHHRMREHEIRHLPVLDGGKLVGVLTDRDVALVMSMREVDPALATVEDAMTTDVHVVPPNAPLDAVAREMAEHRHGSAVVVSNDKVVGVFTTVDACRALATLLHERRLAA